MINKKMVFIPRYMYKECIYRQIDLNKLVNIENVNYEYGINYFSRYDLDIFKNLNFYMHDYLNYHIFLTDPNYQKNNVALDRSFIDLSNPINKTQGVSDDYIKKVCECNIHNNVFVVVVDTGFGNIVTTGGSNGRLKLLNEIFSNYSRFRTFNLFKQEDLFYNYIVALFSCLPKKIV